LDKKGNTVDPQLEKKKFDFAGKALADVWSRLVLDGHPTVAEYIEPSTSELSEENVISKDQTWWETHVRSSQYFTQIVKCDNEKCCKKKRSSLLCRSQKQARASEFLNDRLPELRTDFHHCLWH